ncbi:MAG: ABC transporter permease, partial [Pseudomonadota bacterium]
MTPLSLRLAGRELRAGVRGFRIFLACLALGVAAIAAAGSTAEAFRRGLADQAGEILGGDLSATVEQRRFTPQETAALEAEGPVSVAVNVRAMAEAASGERRLVEWRGVSSAYPLKGKVTLRGAPDLATALASRGGLPGAAVEQDLLDRLGIGLGDSFQAGNLRLRATAVLLEEPDRLSRGFALGPRVVTRIEVVEASGLLAPGLPFVETRRVALPVDDAPDTAKARLEEALGSDARLRVREEAAPGARWLIDQLEYFLAFIGLASLLAGGLGVHGAVSAFLEARRPSIAILKALGASAVLV